MGCGAGRHSFEMYRRGARVTAFDLDQDGLDAASLEVALEDASAADVAGFAGQQARILDALWPCLAAGGFLLYATCSVFAEENEAPATAFAERHPNALRETLTLPAGVVHRGGQLLPSLPGEGHNHDGFFYALFRKA